MKYNVYTQLPKFSRLPLPQDLANPFEKVTLPLQTHLPRIKPCLPIVCSMSFVVELSSSTMKNNNNDDDEVLFMSIISKLLFFKNE
jgi:hypothetical protein